MQQEKKIKTLFVKNMDCLAIVYNRSKTDFCELEYFALAFIRVYPCASVVSRASSAGTCKAAAGLHSYTAAPAEGTVRRIVAFDS
jgi:hypothetical protein